MNDSIELLAQSYREIEKGVQNLRAAWELADLDPDLKPQGRQFAHDMRMLYNDLVRDLRWMGEAVAEVEAEHEPL